MPARESCIVRRGRFAWYIEYPAAHDDGMDTERGPFLTRFMARLSRRFVG